MGRRLLGCLVAAILWPALAGAETPPFRVGLAGPGSRLDVKAESALVEGLSRALGRPVEIVRFDRFMALADAQALKRIDLSVLSTGGYVTVMKLCGCVEPLVAPLAADGTQGYFGIIVARKDAGIADLSGLSDKFIASGPPDSLATRHLQIVALKGDAPGGTFRLSTVEDDLDGVRLVLDGEIDAAFAWSSLSGRREEGFDRGTLRRAAEAGDDVDALSVVWSSAKVPHGPVAILASASLAEKRAARDFFVALVRSAPDLYDALDPIYGGGYAPVEGDAYAALIPLFGSAVEGEAGGAPMPRPRPAVKGAAAPSLAD